VVFAFEDDRPHPVQAIAMLYIQKASAISSMPHSMVVAMEAPW
jgi:hypothetical protein